MTGDGDGSEQPTGLGPNVPHAEAPPLSQQANGFPAAPPKEAAAGLASAADSNNTSHQEAAAGPPCADDAAPVSAPASIRRVSEADAAVAMHRPAAADGTDSASADAADAADAAVTAAQRVDPSASTPEASPRRQGPLPLPPPELVTLRSVSDGATPVAAAADGFVTPRGAGVWQDAAAGSPASPQRLSASPSRSGAGWRPESPAPLPRPEHEVVLRAVSSETAASMDGLRSAAASNAALTQVIQQAIDAGPLREVHPRPSARVVGLVTWLGQARRLEVAGKAWSQLLYAATRQSFVGRAMRQNAASGQCNAAPGVLLRCDVGPK